MTVKCKGLQIISGMHSMSLHKAEAEVLEQQLHRETTRI